MSIILNDIRLVVDDDFVILDKFHWEIELNKIHTLMGVSGVGKTLTLRILAKLINTYSGTVLNLPSKINFAFQSSPLLPWLNLLDNLAICSSDNNLIDQMIVQFNLGHLLHKFPHQLSGGNLQKVNILRSFLNNPDLILMDEPFVHLDSFQKEELQIFTKNLHATYKPTIVFVTHDIDEALFLSHDIAVLNGTTKNISYQKDNLLNYVGNMAELRAHPNYSSDYRLIYNFIKSGGNF